MLDHRRTITSLVREAYYQCFRAQLRLRASALAAYESLTNPASGPLPPPLLRYKVGERLSARTFLDVGKASAERIAGVLAERGLRVGTGVRVLDFGCGCGKTLRWMIAPGGGLLWNRRRLAGHRLVHAQPTRRKLRGEWGVAPARVRG